MVKGCVAACLHLSLPATWRMLTVSTKWENQGQPTEIIKAKTHRKGKKEKRPGGKEREMTIFLKSLETGSNPRFSHYVQKGMYLPTPPPPPQLTLSPFESHFFYLLLKDLFLHSLVISTLCIMPFSEFLTFPQQWRGQLQRSGCHQCPVLRET